MIVAVTKIRICGGSGSGKSYLAQKISRHTKITCTHLDHLRYDFSQTHKFIHKRSKKEFDKRVTKAASKSSWIIEGGYYNATKDTYEQSDIIMYLRPVFIKRIYHTIKRFITRIRDKKYEGVGSFIRLSIYNFSTRKKWQTTRLQLFRKRYSDKLHVFSSADNAYEWFIAESKK